MERILDLTFKGDFKKLAADEEFRNLLTLKLDSAGGKAGKTADVGMVYLQAGCGGFPITRSPSTARATRWSSSRPRSSTS